MGNWKVEKIVIPVIVAGAALLLILGSLKETEEENLQKRLDKWRMVLPADIRAQFDAGHDQVCANMIAERLDKDAGFKKRYEALQDEELTPVFTPKDMVDYYRVYFAGRLSEIRSSRAEPRDLEKLQAEVDRLDPHTVHHYRAAFDLAQTKRRGGFLYQLFHGDELRPSLI